MVRASILLGVLMSSALCAAVEAPDEYSVDCITGKGNINIKVVRNWAPIGADRFHELVLSGYYDDVPFFRMVKGFVVQFGLSSDAPTTAKWKDSTITDDPVVRSNERGYVSFAMRGEHTRTTQLFINLEHNQGLDGMGFAPFAVLDDASMAVVDSLNFEYEQQPDQGLLTLRGADYWKQDFPNLDSIEKCSVVSSEASL